MGTARLVAVRRQGKEEVGDVGRGSEIGVHLVNSRLRVGLKGPGCHSESSNGLETLTVQLRVALEICPPQTPPVYPSLSKSGSLNGVLLIDCLTFL